MENKHQERLQYLAKKLRAHGNRLTPQRMAVLKTLVGNTEHPTIESIYNQVKNEFPMTSLATIYNTISTLREIGEVREIEIHSGSNRYDGSKPTPHPHLICIQCDKIIDIEAGNLHVLAKTVADQTGYQVVDQRLDFFGICPECQSSNTL